MINFGKLHEYKDVFGFFAQMLTYPEKLDFHPSVMEESLDSSHPAYASVRTYWDLMHEYSMEQIEELYVQTFDFQKKSTLYMTYAKFEEGRERGQMLARLKETYQLFGLDIMSSELSDYLPLMCEFLYAAKWQGHEKEAAESLELMIAVMEDGTYHLLKALEKFKSPYFHLIQGLRETFKACIIQEAAAHEHD
ncbi:nitrate reductase molybdenum cofactor assembly chaperone [Paenibacillus dokdonensis]|uniref:Nitrate reductase molybdenum cofactor assembly chaperone n=1 Tax=Paenibacillus dokdonensis TaxID=2567944 RepID=A0ABU6GHF4_9BACL|nr:nitrate reductase molybdenum cofactor assembly chaperone [Paenibacillus dokdonensis]MEC0239195.1 nitrate reductase molybdenum cofactor assembly chaperone [Paenibacillus dokdonensis]